ncbi:hypothetical protein Bca4012_091055 [Brassica carinata]
MHALSFYIKKAKDLSKKLLESFRARLMASSQRSWSLSSLPLDMIEEIFHRTPAESLLRSKPTCKKWYDLIKNKRFIYEHLRNDSLQQDMNTIPCGSMKQGLQGEMGPTTCNQGFK